MRGSAGSDLDPQIDETIRFAQGLFRASGIVFGWVSRDSLFDTREVVGVSHRLMDEYLGGMVRHDPLNVFDLIARREKVAFLAQYRTAMSAENQAIHTGFLDRFGVVDEADLIFWDGGLPIAVLGVLKRPGDPPFHDSEFDWETIRRYLEYNLRQHPHVRKGRRTRQLAGAYGLTPREIEVVSLLEMGAPNAKIAEILGIGVATVKTYIVNILNKLGVDNRASIVAYTAAL